jgi:hypothetical protein
VPHQTPHALRYCNRSLRLPMHYQTSAQFETESACVPSAATAYLCTPLTPTRLPLQHGCPFSLSGPLAVVKVDAPSAALSWRHPPYPIRKRLRRFRARQLRRMRRLSSSYPSNTRGCAPGIGPYPDLVADDGQRCRFKICYRNSRHELLLVPTGGRAIFTKLANRSTGERQLLLR